CFFSSRRRHTRSKRDWSSDVCSSDLCQGVFRSNCTECDPHNGVCAGGEDVHFTVLYKLPSFIFNRVIEVKAYAFAATNPVFLHRSEERRVGKEIRAGWAEYD